MAIKKYGGTLHFLALGLIFAFVWLDNALSGRGLPHGSKVTFYVSWYDVGEEVLEGLNGIKLVNSGFHNFKETNTVWYDPAVITIGEMKQALKKAGTYLGIAE